MFSSPTSLEADPFKSLDDLAVGHLLQTGIQKCREASNNSSSILGGATFDCTILDGDHTSDPRYYCNTLLLCLAFHTCCIIMTGCVNSMSLAIVFVTTHPRVYFLLQQLL